MKTLKLVISVFTLTLPIYSLGADAVKVTPPQQKLLSSENGRYVFGQISEFRRDQFMLDTKTGRLWSIVVRKAKNPDGNEALGEGFAILDPIPYSDINGTLTVEPK